MNIKIQGDEAIIDGSGDCFASKLMKGCKKKVKIKSPFGTREVKLVNEFKSKPKAKKKKKAKG